MYTLVGIERKVGDGTNDRGQPFSWDNLNFYLMEFEEGNSPDFKENGDLLGNRVVIEKAKYEDWQNQELPEIGGVYEIFYNKGGKVSKFVSA